MQTLYDKARHKRLPADAILGAIASAGLVLSGCGGVHSPLSTLTTPSSPTSPAPPVAVQGTIGSTGGTLATPGGARVVIPKGALTADTTIGVEETAAGAPPLPAGAKTFGPIVAFIPHGTNFALPATITLPFDPASVPSGTKLALAKTNDSQTGWEVIRGSMVNGNTISAPVFDFSFATVLPDPSPLDDPPHLVTEQWHFENYYTGSTNPFKTETVVFPTLENADTTLQDAEPAGHWESLASVGLPSVIWFESDLEHVALHPRGVVDGSYNAVFSNQLGTTFWADSVAPSGNVRETHTKIGRLATLTVTRVLQKSDANASLKAVVSGLALDLIDTGAAGPTDAECPWAGSAVTSDPCSASMVVEAGLKLDAWYTLPNGGIVSLRHVDSSVRLHGWRNHWAADVGSSPDSDEPIADKNLELDIDFDSDDPPTPPGQSATLTLQQPDPFKDPLPYVVDIPLDTVQTGGQFNLQITLTTFALNRRQSESFAGAFLRDPTHASNLQFVEQGIEVVRAPVTQAPPEPPPPPTPLPAPACTSGIDPAAGVIQFEKPSIDGFEQIGATALVRVTRSGGGEGAVSAIFSTRDGSARAGVDYRPITTVVRFEDGEQGARLITIPLIDNDTPDGERTVFLSLTEPLGCAALGAQPTSTLVIHDDDLQPTTMPTFHVGGTVTGLDGSGLVLREVISGSTVSPVADGAFTFSSAVFDGASYDVRVQNQPNDPAQTCSISNGAGTIAGGDVTNIVVTCTTVPSNGALDPAFGVTGRVSNLLPPAKALALQSDGKLLAVGSMTLSRYNADGSTETTFGKNGSVIIVSSGGPLDEMEALAVQTDGKILVAGFTSLPTSVNDNFVVLRFNNDGSPDTAFGSSGAAVTDFNGLFDRASAVLVEPDGKIIVAGNATSGTMSRGDLDFAVARYLPNGTLDPAFGTSGKATLNVAGKSDFGTTAVLQADGKILVAGRVFSDAGTEADIGVARFNADGTTDTTFGTHGIVRVDFSSGGVVSLTFSGGSWDEASRLAVQTDGKIMIGGFTQVAGVFRYALVRLLGDGSLDTTFGTNGLVSTPFTTQNDFARSIALQADGKVVLAGQLGNSSTNADIGLARYTNSGALDSTFGTDGLVQVDFFGGLDGASDVLIQPDGRIVAAGSATNGTGVGLGLVRVLP